MTAVWPPNDEQQHLLLFIIVVFFILILVLFECIIEGLDPSIYIFGETFEPYAQV